MPRTANGDYSLPAGSIATNGEVIVALQHNRPLVDIEQALSRSLSRGGQGGMLADLNMNGFKITGVAAGSAAGDLATVGQLPPRQTFATLAALRSANVTDKFAFFDGSAWAWATGNFVGKVDDALIVQSDSTSPSVGAWLRQFEGAVDPRWWGAKADGVQNDSSAIQSAIDNRAAGGGGVVRLNSFGTYKVTNPPIVKDNVVLDLNQATINLAFPAGSDIVGIQIRDNAQVVNGTINGVGVGGPTGLNMVHHCCIIVGESGGMPQGYSGWRIANLVVTNNRDDNVGGVAIIVYSSSNNGIVENITAPDSPSLASVVRIHWHGYTPPGGDTPTISGHPHNIVVRNVTFGTMTKPAQTTGVTGDVAAIDVVAGYNITVENVTGDRWAGDAVFQVRPGAFGSAVADATTKALFMQGIRFYGITCARADNDGFLANGRSHGGGAIAATQYAMPIAVEDCAIVGAGPAATAGKASYKFAFTSGGTLKNCEGSYNDRGFFGDESSSGVVIENCRFHHNQREGAVVVNGTNRPRDYTFRRCFAFANGQKNDVAYAGFYAEAALAVRWIDCTSGDPAGETGQFYGFRVEPGAEGCSFGGVTRAFVKAGGTRYSFMEPVLGDRQLSGGSIGQLSTTATQYVPINGVAAPATAEADASLLQGVQLVVTNFRVMLDAAPNGAGKSRTFKLVQDGAATGLEVSIVDNASSGGSVVAAVIPAGSPISVQSLAATGPAAARVRVSVEGFLG